MNAAELYFFVELSQVGTVFRNLGHYWKIPRLIGYYKESYYLAIGDDCNSRETYPGWWFQTCFIFHFIYVMSSFPLTFTPSFFKMVKFCTSKQYQPTVGCYHGSLQRAKCCTHTRLIPMPASLASKCRGYYKKDPSPCLTILIPSVENDELSVKL